MPNLRSFTGYAALAMALACSKPPPAPGPAAATAPTTAGAGELRPELSAAERQQALQGKALFHQQFTAAQGLGPHFNFSSCAACHDQPASGGHGDKAHSARLTVIDNDVDGLPQKDLPGLLPLVPPVGAPVSMHKPPPLYGLGLLEAIPDAVIRDNCGRSQELGIGGVANINPGQHRVSRFGYKAHTATLEDFIANALNLEIGITNPQERDVRHQRDDDAVPDPETPTSTVQLLVQYVQALAPPPPPAANPQQEAQFRELGCATCHRPQTAPGALAYTDLCVHDLGAGFDNGMRDFLAGPRHWRTAPLWGLRWRDHYFHDDRAAALPDAIAMHGGEAQVARDRFLALDPAAQAELVAWLARL